jgi:hypothetical protein
MRPLGKPAYTDPERPTCDPDAARYVLETITDLLAFTPPGSTHWGPWDIYAHMIAQDDIGYCP